MSGVETVQIASVSYKGSFDGTRARATSDYKAKVRITGTAPILFHRWDDAVVQQKSEAAKNSRAKKTDNLESYVYRTSDGEIGIPAMNFKACLRETARSFQDPRSPRKSAVDLVTASVQIEPFIASLGRKEWDAVNIQRVVVQRSAAISRARPMFHEGWQVEFAVLVLAPEYIIPAWLHDLITRAGRFTGLGDFRPDYGRFRLDSFSIEELL